MKKQSGKTAIVTGASTGIGKATAEALARAGFTVFGTSRKATKNGSGRVTMLKCDVTDDGSVRKLVSDVLGRTGRIDLLVNNAGIALFGGAEESSIDQVRALFDVNLFGVMRVTNAVLPSMRKNGGGRIINMSSIVGFAPAPYAAHYGASKHALEGYSESLDYETRAFNVRVSVIEPAFTRSALDENALTADSQLKEYDVPRTHVGALIRNSVSTTGDPPEMVADTVVLAATARRPKRRYPAGKIAKQLTVARRIVPAEMFDKSLRKQFGLDGLSGR
jgi:NAD(P)-dependent dehydrogenase (short-subunit alcohol dehydrogenase family)